MRVERQIRNDIAVFLPHGKEKIVCFQCVSIPFVGFAYGESVPDAPLLAHTIPV
jgi:hypothetical protein